MSRRKVKTLGPPSDPCEVTPTGVQPKLAYQHEAPVLCCNFSRDGQRVVSGGADKKVKMKILQTQQEQQIGQHDAPVKEVFVVDDMNMVVSAGWDKTVRFWNCQQPNPVATLQLPERIYSMDIKYPLMVVGCAERHLCVYNLQQIQQNPNPYKQGPTALKMQTRCVSCFPDRTGYALVMSGAGGSPTDHRDSGRPQPVRSLVLSEVMDLGSRSRASGHARTSNIGFLASTQARSKKSCPTSSYQRQPALIFRQLSAHLGAREVTLHLQGRGDVRVRSAFWLLGVSITSGKPGSLDLEVSTLISETFQWLRQVRGFCSYEKCENMEHSPSIPATRDVSGFLRMPGGVEQRWRTAS